MAAVSAPLASRPLTPPISSHGAQSAWGYSVPLENQIPLETAADYPNYEIPAAARQPLVGQTNGPSLASKRSRNELSHIRPPSRSNQIQNQAYRSRPGTATRKEIPMSESVSGDNPQEFRGRGPLNGIEHSAISGEDSVYDDEDPEHSRWIHKDKLERMEIEEMERLGIRIPGSRSASRSNGRSKSRNRNEQQGQQKKQKMEATPRDEEEEGNWDLRRPEEREARDAYWDQVAGSKSASRIPVCKTSPVPVPIDFIERDHPMQYGKNPGPSGTDDTISYAKPRGRSGSVKALDDSMVSNNKAASPRSASAQALSTDASPAKKTPRKASAPMGRTNPGHQRQKNRSGSNVTRPAKGSGDFNSGSASKRPEGDPPWLATMYKPDPRLPPDQQILPTHAKRMQQEQWERDGKFGNAYDTSFRPLNDEDFGERPPIVPQSIEVKEEKPEDQPGWPLITPISPTLSTGPKSPTSPTGRPSTAGGGYSTMPKITSPVRQPSSPLPSPTATQPMNPLRVPDPAEEEKQEKKEAGCACCIIM